MSAPRCLRAYMTMRLLQDSGLVAACGPRLGPGTLPPGIPYPYQYWLTPQSTGTIPLGRGVIRQEYRVQVGVTGKAEDYDLVASLAERQRALLDDYFRPFTNQFGTITAVSALGAGIDIPDKDEAGLPVVRVGDVYLIALRAFDLLAPESTGPMPDEESGDTPPVDP